MITRALLVSLFLLLPSPAPAQLASVDLDAPGDGLLSRDTDAGLDWLDLLETVGLAWDDIQAGAGGWIGA